VSDGGGVLSGLFTLGAAAVQLTRDALNPYARRSNSGDPWTWHAIAHRNDRPGSSFEQQRPPNGTLSASVWGTTTNANSPSNGGATSSTESTIGQAHMLADRTLVLELHTSDLRDSIGAGSFRYPTVHPQYEEILAHAGPMQPGQRRPVRAF